MLLSLILLVGLALCAIGGGVYYTRKTHRQIGSTKDAKRVIPRAVSMFILVVQFSELTRVIEHASIVHITVAVFLLALWASLRKESEGELF